VRFAEIALLALPLVVFVAWRLLAPVAGPPRVLVVATAATVAVMVGVLLGFWYVEAEPPGTGYVPAQLQDGRIVPGRVVAVSPGRVVPAVPRQVVPATPDQAISPSASGHPGND
jgi:hypothetical protein